MPGNRVIVRYIITLAALLMVFALVVVVSDRVMSNDDRTASPSSTTRPNNNGTTVVTQGPGPTLTPVTTLPARDVEALRRVGVNANDAPPVPVGGDYVNPITQSARDLRMSLPSDWATAMSVALRATELVGTPNIANAQALQRVVDPELYRQWLATAQQPTTPGTLTVTRLFLTDGFTEKGERAGMLAIADYRSPSGALIRTQSATLTLIKLNNTWFLKQVRFEDLDVPAATSTTVRAR
jgi:hypothetical protein